MTYGTTRVNATPQPTGAAEGCTGRPKAGTVSSVHTDDPQRQQSHATGFVIELPLPPSVNSYVRRLGNQSPGVRRWRLLCDGYLWELWGWLKNRSVKGPFLIDITWTRAEKGKSDIDNRIKPLLDYLQAKQLIENDKLCVAMRVGYGETKFGCRIEVLPRREL